MYVCFVFYQMLKTSRLQSFSNILVLTFSILKVYETYGSVSKEPRDAKAFYLKQRPGSTPRILPFRNVFIPYNFQDRNYQDYINITGKSLFSSF